jgi:hypothetical protein
MALHIDDDYKSQEAGETLTCAAVRPGHLRPATGWPGHLNRNTAITALTVTEWLLCRPERVL